MSLLVSLLLRSPDLTCKNTGSLEVLELSFKNHAALKRQNRCFTSETAAGQAGLPEQPLACSRCTTEACKNHSLEGLWMYGVTVYLDHIYGRYSNTAAAGANFQQLKAVDQVQM